MKQGAWQGTLRAVPRIPVPVGPIVEKIAGQIEEYSGQDQGDDGSQQLRIPGLRISRNTHDGSEKDIARHAGNVRGADGCRQAVDMVRIHRFGKQF